MNSAAGLVAPKCQRPRELELYGDRFTVGCGRRSCPRCGLVWLQDTRIRTLAAAQQLGGAVALVTVTAPGQDLLPWDHTGRRVEERAARDWNRTATARWSQMHRAAATAARRHQAGRVPDWCLLVKTWEYQRRGVLHLHLLLPAATSCQLAASEAYVAALGRLAPLAGFGFVDRGKLPDSGRRRSARRLSPVSPHRAAAYVASYVASTGAGKGGIAEVAANQGVPGAIVYLSRRLTQASGVTMRSLKDRRRVSCRFPQARQSTAAWRAACVVDAIDRGRPPLTPEARAALLVVALSERWRATVDMGTGEVRSATSAPAPPTAHDGGDVSCTTRRVAPLRLDSVLHHGHTDGRPRWRTTAVREVRECLDAA